MLLAALGVREHGASPPAFDAAERRACAFTLFMRAYDQARRAVIFLRWDEGDADEIAPSLYKGRGGRGQRAEAPAEAPAASTEAPAAASTEAPAKAPAASAKAPAASDAAASKPAEPPN